MVSRLLAPLSEYQRKYAEHCGYPVSTEREDTRDRMRFSILDHQGREVTLSVPVAGGAKALKSAKSDPMISHHGRWWPVMEGTINAAYGNTPFFPHIFPQLQSIMQQAYDSATQDTPISSSHLITQADEWVAQCIDLPTLLISGEDFRLRHPDIIRQHSSRILTRHPDLSILHYLMHYGPEVIFLIHNSNNS